MRLSAVDSIHHGLLNLRANWQLPGVLFVQTLVVSIISLLGFVPIVLVLGFGFLRGVLSQLDSVDGSRLLETVLEAGVPLILAVVAASLIWTLAFVVYCYFQGGVLGTLAAGERQALSDGIRWQSYRTFSARSFFGFAEGLTWPIFWLINLFFLIGMALITGFGIAAIGLFVLLREGPGAVQFAVGCSGFLVLVLLVMLLSAWMQLSLVEAASSRRGAMAASRAALAIAGKRLPGLALLFLLMIVVSIVVAIVVAPLSMVLEIGLRDRIAVYFVGQAVVTLAQWLASSILSVACWATLLALVTGEREAPA